MQNNGKFNDLNHFHLHVYPRYTNDSFKWIYDTDKVWSQEELEVVAQEFKY